VAMKTEELKAFFALPGWRVTVWRPHDQDATVITLSRFNEKTLNDDYCYAVISGPTLRNNTGLQRTNLLTATRKNLVAAIEGADWDNMEPRPLEFVQEGEDDVSGWPLTRRTDTEE